MAIEGPEGIKVRVEDVESLNAFLLFSGSELFSGNGLFPLFRAGIYHFFYNLSTKIIKNHLISLIYNNTCVILMQYGE